MNTTLDLFKQAKDATSVCITKQHNAILKYLV